MHSSLTGKPVGLFLCCENRSERPRLAASLCSYSIGNVEEPYCVPTRVGGRENVAGTSVPVPCAVERYNPTG
jgi:hypothetical protein